MKSGRDIEVQKQVSINLIKENIFKLHGHYHSLEQKQSSLFKKRFVCTLKKCPWKAVIILLGAIKNGLYDDVEIRDNYQGFVIFTGFTEKHKITTQNEFMIMPNFETIVELLENHNVPKYNLAAIVIKEKFSVHTNPEEAR